MKHYPFVILLLTSLCLSVPDQVYADDEVFGYWASDGSIIHITQNPNAQLSAKVFALMEPVYVEGEEFGPVGAVRRDDLNPEPEKRTMPIIGLELLSEYAHTGKRWEGKIYDPESGNTYSSRMEVDNSGELKMRGYIGLPMLGRTARFEPLSKCTQRMQTMLSRSDQSIGDCPPPIEAD